MNKWVFRFGVGALRNDISRKGGDKTLFGVSLIYMKNTEEKVGEQKTNACLS